MILKSTIVDDLKTIIQLDTKKAFLATGYNVSISNEKTISLMGKTFNLDDQYLGFSLKDINNQLGVKIDYLIGSDILSNFNYSINMKKKEFLLSTDEITADSNGIPLHIELNIPYLPVKVNEKEIIAMFDSASRFSYLHEKNIKNQQVFQDKQDYFLNMGNFSLKTCMVDYSINNESISLETGIYPKVITKSRLITVDKGVLGSELLNYYSMTINSSSKKVILEKF